MNPNGQTPQDYSNLPVNNNDERYTSFNNVEISNIFNNTSHPATQNVTYEFYFPSLLSNDARIYHVTYQYTELGPLENVRRLNNSINLPHIPDHQFPLHDHMHSLIQQQIQQVQQPVYQQNTEYNIQQPTSQVYSNNNAYDTAASNTVNGPTISDNIPDTGFQNAS
ncbi:hypothetical protein RclHR1_08610001 [Rhizophagus clarus]|uniref:Uncharacterized protein n=1 Tax=Rhizophagus clarus TaxID=94130 RepID=A0A2Z6S1P7_9GLOM|nr:hypothetical protein RclHR1_08610001 [Rhizophagus clarus]GES99100.1 hypothetical protein GLOIN_2v812944 [Rhizophagus clarus]